MITWEEVMELRQRIPPRYPRGDTRNLLRIGPERRFSAAARRYKKEHGISWWSQPGRDYNKPKKTPEDLEKIKASIDRLEELGIPQPTIAKLRRWLNKLQREAK